MMKSDMSYCRKTAVEQVISDFLFHCQYEKNLNEKTIYAYRSDLYMFNRYIHELYPSVVFEQRSEEHRLNSSHNNQSRMPSSA